MNLELLNPHVRYARRHISRFIKGRGVSRCYDARLFYFVNAEGTLTVNNVKYNFSNKSAIYLPPLSCYTIRVSLNEHSEVTVFNLDLTQENTDIRKSLGTPTVAEFDERIIPHCLSISGFENPIIKTSSKISQHVLGALSAFSDERGHYLERCSAHMKLALLELIEEDEREYSPLCKSILSYISENLSDPSLTNGSIAEKFNYHPYYVNRIIKREVGKSLRAYIIDARLDAASDELVSGDCSVSRVAEHAGFSSPSYFIKLFRERKGMTPLEYRASNNSVQL